MKFFYTIVIIVLFPIFSLASGINKEDDYFENIVIIKVKPEYQTGFKNTTEFNSIFSEVSLKEVVNMFPDAEIPKKKYNQRGEKLVDLSLIYQLYFSENVNVPELVSELQLLDFIEYAEPLYNVELLYVPDDPMNQTDQYWLDNIKAYDAWNIHKGDTNTVIGIVDTGIDISHEDLIYNISYNWNDLPNGNDDDNDGYIDNFRGWDFGDNNNNPQAEVSFHGSWVSGIAAASTDNGVGMSGVGFKCRFLPIKVMNADGVINTAYQGVVYAADQGSKVINCSWGNTTYQNMAQDVINYVTYNRDALVIGACGNSNSELIFYPASYENVISVAATTVNDERWSPQNTSTGAGSSYGPMVDISAPGTMMRTTGDGGYFLTYGGTSFAAPVVSGAAALLRSYYPQLSALQIGQLLKAGTDNIDTVEFNIPYQGMMGSGRLNVYNSITMDFVPAPVFKNVQISENRAAGDTVNITGEIINYLAPVDDLIITVSTESPHIEILNPTINIGYLDTFSSFEITDYIKFKVLDGAPYDYFAYINLDYSTDDFNNSQSIPVTMNYSFKDIETERLRLSIVKNGRLGYSDNENRIGNGMWLNNLSRLFYDSGIISGTSATNVFCAVRQESDFNTTVLPKTDNLSVIGDSRIRTEFNKINEDSEDLDLNFIQTAYTWNDQDYEDFIIIRYQIFNSGLIDINSYYFGLFIDWDLINPADNSVAYNSDADIMYCKNNGTASLYSGTKLLTDQNSNNYAVAQISGGDGIVDITDDFTDIEKFHVISNTQDSVGSPDDGYDVVLITSAGPFDIPVGDTVEIAFALVVSESFYSFKKSCIKADDLYKSLFSESNVVDSNEINFSVFPSPADNFIKINFQNIYIDKKIEIFIYDTTGKLIKRQSEIVKPGSIFIDTSVLPDGLYYVNIESNDNVISGNKFMIQR